LDEHDITRHDYGGKVETDCAKFVDGLIELFDDLADFALSRLYKKLYSVNPDFDVETLPQADIDHFKLTWYVALAELMFFSMKDQAKLEEIKDTFYDEMELTAAERKATPFLLEARSAIPNIIARNSDFVERGIVNAPMSNRDEDTPRNRGLGPELASVILETSFATNPMVGPAYDDILETFELEFNNAYGHCSIACSTFTIV
jgi:hypothetical protein